MTVPAPQHLDGGRLTNAQRDRLSSMLTVVQKSDPSRSKEYVLNQALKAFSKTAFLSRGRWVDRQKFNLNNGKGPLVIPSWSSLLDGQ